MLYGTAMNGAGWEIPPNASAENPSGSTWNYIKQWIDDPNIPNNKLVLAMTAYTGGGLTSGQVKFFSDLVNKYKLAGILYWPGNANFPSSNCWLKNGFGGDTSSCIVTSPEPGGGQGNCLPSDGGSTGGGGGGGGGTNRCGADWTSAQNGKLCPGGTDGECPSGQKCYSGF